MSRLFFDQIDDELRGLLGPRLRAYRSARGSRLLKLWYAHPAVHFEVQLLGTRWSPYPGPTLEVGLHLEHQEAGENDRLLAALAEDRPAWVPRLPNAVAGPALGPRAGAWRRVSEYLRMVDEDDGDLASEAAECLAGYVRTLWPLLAPLAAGAGGEEAAPEAQPG